LWIYIERKESNSGLLKLGKSQLIKNDVLIIEIDNYGILLNKTFYNIDDMNNIKFVDATTSTEFKKNSFIYNFLSSMRQKINDPLGVRAKKREEIRQR
jgi:outer membrane protein assembly factor BamE (lipoprotein component of BamABCDE complex)